MNKENKWEEHNRLRWNRYDRYKEDMEGKPYAGDPIWDFWIKELEEVEQSAYDKAIGVGEGMKIDIKICGAEEQHEGAICNNCESGLSECTNASKDKSYNQAVQEYISEINKLKNKMKQQICYCHKFHTGPCCKEDLIERIKKIVEEVNLDKGEVLPAGEFMKTLLMILNQLK